jgi:hypothetical protein
MTDLSHSSCISPIPLHAINREEEAWVDPNEPLTTLFHNLATAEVARNGAPLQGQGGLSEAEIRIEKEKDLQQLKTYLSVTALILIASVGFLLHRYL